MPPKTNKNSIIETDLKPLQINKKEELNEDELAKERLKIASIKSNIEVFISIKIFLFIF